MVRLVATFARGSVAAAVAMGVLACSGRTLIAVDPCPASELGGADGSTCTAPVDARSRDGDAAASDRPGQTLRTGLVGLWHLDEGPGATMAADASGNGNDGILMKLDSATAWTTGGHLGNALAIGAQGYVRVPMSESIASIVSGVTMSAWIYFEGPVSDYATALSRQIGTSLGQYYHLSLWQADGEPSMFITPNLDTAPTRPTWSVATPVKSWTHLAGTYDGTTANLYVDGNQVASLPVTGMFASDTTPLILGGNGNGSAVTELFPGRLDEIALYNRALDSAEIQQLAHAASF